MMASYTAGFYRINDTFGDDTIRRTLVALHKLDLGFLPAELLLSKQDRAVLREPEDYRRDLIPSTYFISPGVALEGALEGHHPGVHEHQRRIGLRDER